MVREVWLAMALTYIPTHSCILHAFVSPLSGVNAHDELTLSAASLNSDALHKSVVCSSYLYLAWIKNESMTSPLLHAWLLTISIKHRNSNDQVWYNCVISSNNIINYKQAVFAIV
jgi:hypothetical protein